MDVRERRERREPRRDRDVALAAPRGLVGDDADATVEEQFEDVPVRRPRAVVGRRMGPIGGREPLGKVSLGDAVESDVLRHAPRERRLSAARRAADEQQEGPRGARGHALTVPTRQDTHKRAMCRWRLVRGLGTVWSRFVASADMDC